MLKSPPFSARHPVLCRRVQACRPACEFRLSMAVIVLPAGAAFIAGVVGVGYTFTASRQRVVDKLESKFGEVARRGAHTL